MSTSALSSSAELSTFEPVFPEDDDCTTILEVVNTFSNTSNDPKLTVEEATSLCTFYYKATDAVLRRTAKILNKIENETVKVNFLKDVIRGMFSHRDSIDVLDVVAYANTFFPASYHRPKKHIYVIVDSTVTVGSTAEKARGKRTALSEPEEPEKESKKDPELLELFNNIYDIVNLFVNKEGITDDDLGKLADDLDRMVVDKEPTIPIIIKHPQGKMLPVIGKSALYVRESYHDLYELITSQVTVSNTHPYKFLISGTSGIGKSCFLIYLLIRLLCTPGATVIFQPRQKRVRNKIFYCFNNNSLSSGSFDDFSSHFRSFETWYLADGILSSELVKARTVVALSPKGVNKEDFQEFDKVLVQKFYMPPWSYEELLKCREGIFPTVPANIMTTLYEMAGGVPRYVLQRVEYSINHGDTWNKVVEKSFERVKFSLKQVDNTQDLIYCVTENANYIQFSSRLIHQWPSPFYDSYSLGWGSYYIYNDIQNKLVKQASINFIDKIQSMRSYPRASGIMFEMHVIHLLQDGGHFTMRHLPGTGEKLIKDRKLDIKQQQINNFIRTASQLSTMTIGDKTLVLPIATNFGAVDLLFTPDTILQITVSDDHPIKQVELVKIVENMPAFRKKGVIRLVFVVPDDIYDGYKHQDIVTKDEKTKTFRKVNAKLKNVQQWVLKIDMTKRSKFKI